MLLPTKCSDPVRSESVYRKIRSEKMALNDRDRDDLVDMILMQREHNNYIQLVSSPLQVYLYSREQLDILLYLMKPVLQLDATGKLVRKTLTSTKRVFYYAGVVNIPSNERLFPLFEMISCNHDGTTIANWLLKFKSFCLSTIKKWPVFRAVVIDFSFAFINAVCLAWNSMEMKDYLNLTFEVAVGEKELPDNITPIHLCCFHILKLIVSDINKYFFNAGISMQIKELVAAVFNINKWETLCLWFDDFWVLLNSPHMTLKVKESLNRLISICCESTRNILVSESCNKSPDINIGPEKSTLYESSPFFRYFHKRLEYFATEAGESNVPRNEYYSEQFFRIFMKKYIPVISLWSGLLLSNERLSNCNVERWFGFVKDNVMKGLVNHKCSRVVRKLRKYVVTIHTELKYNIHKKSKKRLSKIKTVQVDEGLLSQESWQKKSKKRKSYFEYPTLKKIFINTEKSNQDDRDRNLDEGRVEEYPTICRYCEKGALDVTANWVACDKCNGWIHQSCVIDQTNFDGSFTCDICKNTPKKRGTQLLFLDNGLINDVRYYQKLPTNRLYYVTFHKSINCDINEITIEEYSILNSKEYMTNFMIDICMQLINTLNGNRAEIISAYKSGQIFLEDSGAWKNKFSYLTDGTVAMPFLVNNNHWVLAVAFFAEKKFLFLNPLGEAPQEINKFFGKFCSYLKREEVGSWKITRMKHSKQIDSYNCGAWIIFFFEKITQGSSLLTNLSINDYKHTLQYMLLQNSDPVNDICIYCGFNTIQKRDTYQTCIYCNRISHDKCLRNKSNQYICELCKMY